MNEFQRKARAERVNSVRGDIEAVLNEMDARYIALWKKADTVEGREDAHRMVRLIKDFRGHLFAVAFDGAIADETIKDRERKWKFPGM